MRSLQPLSVLCCFLLVLRAVASTMPSTFSNSSSTALFEGSKSAAVSLRSPATLDHYQHGAGSPENALAERAALASGLLMLLPASIALSSMAVYRSGATNLAFGIGTTILAIVVNIWWFWWMEGWKEFLWQLEEQRVNTKIAQLNLQAKLQEIDRNNQLHKPTLEKATYDAQKARQDAANQKWENKYLPKLTAEEHWAEDMPDLEEKWKAAKAAADEAVGDGLNLDSREAKQKVAEEKYDEWKKALDAWKSKAKEAIENQELDPFAFQRQFWEGVSGEDISQNVRRSGILRDGHPRFLHESCSTGLCERVWYSNSLHESRKRDVAGLDVIHKVYLTPTDFDFRASGLAKRDSYGYDPEDVECDGEGEDVLAARSYHTALELKGTGDGTDLEQIAKYVRSHQDDALRQLGDAMSKGQKVKDKNGHEVTILAHEGWTCIALTVNDKPTIWGLHGMFLHDDRLRDNHDDVWEDCRKQLKI